MSSRHSHTSHRERDQRGGSSRSATSQRPTLNEYWIDGEGIHREVLQGEICRFLGSEATCRPGDYNGRTGYKIKALRPFTPEMLEDLKAASREFGRENRALQDRYREGSRGNTASPKSSNKKIEVSYEDSETRRRNDATLPGAQYSNSTPSGYGSVGNHANPYAAGQYSSIQPGNYGGGDSGYGAPGPNYAGGGQYPPASYASMPPNIPNTVAYAGGGEPRYPHYTYSSQQPREQYGQPESGYRYASGPGGYEPPRSRGEPMPAEYPFSSRAPDGRPTMPAMPAGYASYDTPMGGTSGYGAPGGYPPTRDGVPSQYGSARDPHGSSGPRTESYPGGPSRRR